MSGAKHPLKDQEVRVTILGRVTKLVREDLVEITLRNSGIVQRLVLAQDQVKGTWRTPDYSIEFDSGDYEPGAWYQDSAGRLWQYDQDLVGSAWHLGGDRASRGNPTMPVRAVDSRW